MSKITKLREWYNKRAPAPVSYKTFRSRVVNLGWDKDKAISTPPRQYKKNIRVYKGQAYSIMQLYKEFCEVDISYITFRNRLLLHDFSINEACTWPKNQPRK